MQTRFYFNLRSEPRGERHESPRKEVEKRAGVCPRFCKFFLLEEKMPPMAAVNSTTTSPPPPKRLLFDRRYGWVLDEWKEPSQEALSGGRGMFCIVPLAKALLEKASESINFVGSSTLNVLERPDMLSPKAIQATLSDQMHKIISSVKNAELVLMSRRRNNKTESTSRSSDLPEEHTESHTERNVG